MVVGQCSSSPSSRVSGATLFLGHVTSVGAFIACCLVLGLTVGTTWAIPPVQVVDLVEDREAALASYRISADVGMLAGGLLAGTAIDAAGEQGALLWASGALVVVLLVAIAIGETLNAARRRTSSGAPELAPFSAALALMWPRPLSLSLSPSPRV